MATSPAQGTRYDFIESDKRIMDQKVRKHQLSQAEYQKLLKTAPDEKDLSEEVIVYKDSDVEEIA